MVEAIIGAGAVILVGGVAGVYRLGLANGKKNGNGHSKVDLSQFMTRDLCAERHLAVNNNLTDIKEKVDDIPHIKAWIDTQKTAGK